LLNFRELVNPVTAGYDTPTGRAVVADSTGGFFPFVGQQAVLQDFKLDLVGADKWEFNDSPFEFINIGGGAITFILDKFTLEKKSGGDWFASLSGVFQDGTFGNGGFDPLNDSNFPSIGSSYTFDIEAVPTPAMIPGLVGMGLAALRKRKDESSTEAEA
jgi:hypothetical protein